MQMVILLDTLSNPTHRSAAGSPRPQKIGKSNTDPEYFSVAGPKTAR